MTKTDQFPKIPWIIRLAIVARIITTLVLTILTIMYSGFSSDFDKNQYVIMEASMFFLLSGPYFITGLILCFKRKLGMQCLVVVSGLELLIDMISLLFNYQIFGGVFVRFISYVQMGSGYINTPFSSCVFLYLGTHWREIYNPSESNFNNKSVTSCDDKKFYYSDLIATSLVIILGVWAYGSFNLGGKAIFQLLAFVVFLEGITIRLHHYWRWIGITIAAMLLRFAFDAEFDNLQKIIWGLLQAIYPAGYGACMFSVAVLVYVIKRNIKGE